MDDNKKEIFNKYYNREEFIKEDEIEILNNIINTFGDELITDEIFEKIVRGRYTDYNEPVSFPIKGMDQLERVIELYDMSLTNVKVEKSGIRILNEYYTIREEWKSPNDGYTVDFKYILNVLNFLNKDIKIQKAIIKELIRTNNIVDGTNEFLNLMSEHDKLYYYDILLKKSIEEEFYEQSAIFRDIIHRIKYGGDSDDDTEDLSIKFKSDIFKENKKG